MNRQLLQRYLMPWLIPLILLVLWEVLFSQGIIDNAQWAKPSQVFDYLLSLLSASDFWQGVGSSLVRLVVGLIIGGVLGVGFGVLIAKEYWFNRLFEPTFNGFRQISLFAWVPLLSVYFGYGEASKIIFIVLASFFPIALNTHMGVRTIDQKLLEAARIFHLSRQKYWVSFLLPAAAPQIFVGIQLGVIYAWLGVIGAEFLLRSFETKGIADALIQGRSAYLVDQIIAGTLIIGVLGVFLNKVVVHIESRALAYLPRVR